MVVDTSSQTTGAKTTTEAKTNGAFLTQSPYFTPAFNAAIFDGPIRIYFAQYQENHALSMYFNIQDKLGHVYREAKEAFKLNGRNIFVMLYPTPELYSVAFPRAEEDLSITRLGDDFVFGLRVAALEAMQSRVLAEIEIAVKEWKQEFKERTLVYASSDM